MKVSTENDNNFGHEKITIVVDNIPLRKCHVMVIEKFLIYHQHRLSIIGLICCKICIVAIHKTKYVKMTVCLYFK
jgi:hypothetical protein